MCHCKKPCSPLWPRLMSVHPVLGGRLLGGGGGGGRGSRRWAGSCGVSLNHPTPAPRSPRTWGPRSRWKGRGRPLAPPWWTERGSRPPAGRPPPPQAGRRETRSWGVSGCGRSQVGRVRWGPGGERLRTPSPPFGAAHAPHMLCAAHLLCPGVPI